MNKAILIVICDFLVSAMLTMMTGMVPGHSGGTGVGLDESTTKVLLNELNHRQQELEVLRQQLREAWERSGITPEQEAELRRISNELAKNLNRQQQLRARISGGKPDDSPDGELRAQLESSLSRQRELEEKLDTVRQQLKESAGKLRAHERDNAVLNRELARTRDSLDSTSKKLAGTQDELLRETRAHSQTRDKLNISESGRQNAEKLAAQSSQELVITRKELLSETRSHSQTREKLAASETGRKAAEEKAERSDKELDSTKSELAQTRKERDESRSAFSATQMELVKTQGDLRRAASDLRNMTGNYNKVKSENEKFHKDQEKLRLILQTSKTTLAVREQDYAEMKDRLQREQQKFLVERLKRQDVQTQLDMMAETMKDLVSQYSQKEQELSKTKEKLANTEGELKAKQNSFITKNAVATAVVQDNSKVFEKYAAALVKVNSQVTEKKFMGERTGKTESFYPVVDFGNNRVMIAGAFNRFAGDWDVVMDFDKVTAVNMSYSSPFDKSQQPRKLSSRMLVSSTLPHLAGFEYLDSATPVQAINSVEVIRYGVENLYLFKSGSSTNTSLRGRVSLIPDKQNPAIFIRDIGRMGQKVEQGDFILNTRGDFVGIVSGKTRINGVDGMLVPLIKDVNALWDKAVAIPLSKNPQEQFYSSYGQSIRNLRKSKKLKGGYDRK